MYITFTHFMFLGCVLVETLVHHLPIGAFMIELDLSVWTATKGMYLRTLFYFINPKMHQLVGVIVK